MTSNEPAASGSRNAPHLSYIEFNSGDVEASAGFYREVFDWDPQPWGVSEDGDLDYFVAGSDSTGGIPAGFAESDDGQPVTVATIAVDDIAGYMAKVIIAGGEIVVPKFAIPGVGYGCYFTDTTGMIVGLHQADEEAGERNS